MKKYRVAYVTGSRADYGIVKRYLKLLERDDEIDFSVLVTGSHLESRFGYTVNLIKEDGFQIRYEVPLNIENDTNAKVIHSMALALESFGLYFEDHKFDLLIILGDRYEIMAAALAAAMQKIPILHLHGGETTYGNYDEFIRHSITKMSQYHFTSTEPYRKRVIQLGENPEKVFNLGALGAENCCKINLQNVRDEIKKITPHKYWVIMFHPETLTDINIEEQAGEILDAIDNFSDEYEFVFMGTNADTGSGKIQQTWLKYVKTHENTYYFENLNVDSFLSLVKNAIALIGNSSSGIIEAPSLGVYTINIGDRQKGRIHGNSVIDVVCDSAKIAQAMKKVCSFLKQDKQITNPYYIKNTALVYYKKTKEILRNKIDIIKTFYDLI